MRYRFRCTVSRENAYTSGVGPGAGSVASITRAPGTAAISAPDAKPVAGILGSGWPRGTGTAYVRPDTVMNRSLPSRDQLMRVPVPYTGTGVPPPNGRRIVPPARSVVGRA